jgi:DnaK suppressor protein
MRDTISGGVAERTAAAIHETLIRRYSDAYEAWTRQDAVANAMRADLTAGSSDAGDRRAVQTQIEEQEALATVMRRHLDDLALAVERSENGTYGICLTCGDSIAGDRLTSFPAATQCVACKQEAEHH